MILDVVSWAMLVNPKCNCNYLTMMLGIWLLYSLGKWHILVMKMIFCQDVITCIHPQFISRDTLINEANWWYTLNSSGNQFWPFSTQVFGTTLWGQQSQKQTFRFLSTIIGCDLYALSKAYYGYTISSDHRTLSNPINGLRWIYLVNSMIQVMEYTWMSLNPEKPASFAKAWYSCWFLSLPPGL